MYAIKSSEGYWNDSRECWVNEISEASHYLSKDICVAFAAVVIANTGERADIFEF